MKKSPRTFNQAILQTLTKSLSENEKVMLLGLGITDPKGFFGTTTGLHKSFGANRILECPTSENAYLGHALGLSLGGFTPIVHFQRMDFMLYAYDQLINNIAKWRDMFSQGYPIPIVIRTLVGMGWGQGAQHSQNLAPFLAQVPGLKVVTPSCPQSAAGLLAAAIDDGSPVVFVEHRWLQGLSQDVATDSDLEWKIGKSLVRKKGSKITIVSWSYGVVEALRFSELFPQLDCEIIDLLSLSPLDLSEVNKSVEKTRQLIMWEPSYAFSGIGAEIISKLTENGWMGKVLRLGYSHSYPSASAHQVYDHYLSLDKIISQINSKFKLDLQRTSDMKWPQDQDMAQWSPWSAAALYNENL